MAFGWWSCPRRSRFFAAVCLLAWLVITDVTHAALTSRHQQIHKKMSVDDLRRTFQVEHHSQVPEYEIVHLSKRSIPSGKSSTTPSPTNNTSATSLRLEAFGRRMTLRLERADSLLGPSGRVRMWEATPNTKHPHKVSYTELDDKGDPDIGELYQDESQLAALILHKSDEGKTLVEGTIGHDLVVKPVPASVRQHLDEHGPHDDDEAFLDEDEDQLAEDEEAEDDGLQLQHEPLDHPHIVFRRETQNDPNDASDFAWMEPDALIKTVKRKRRHISKREAPYAIYPEILVIVDFDGYRLHNGDNVQIKRYFISFWNGVDLRYKTLKGPKIRISIAGIIISRGRDATPYLERNRVGRDAIDSAAALTDMGKYLFRERRLPVYDIAVAVTKLDMCRRQFPTDKCNRGTAGFAYVGGACVVNKRLEKVNSVAIIEDTGGFSGIIVGAHEVGHLLGAVHDGSPPPSYLGGPGAEKCRWEDGFIMSDLRHTEKGFRWSACSIASFHHFLNGDTATCLFNSPHEDESLPRVLPGKMLSLDAQCRKDRGTAACFKDERVCSQLFCFDSGSGYCIAYRPAAEGSPCGDGQYCLSGRCVAEHENIIPDYSHHTPSYVRRDGTPAIPGSGEQDAAATQTRPIYGRLGLNSTTSNNRPPTTPLTPSVRTLPTTARTTHYYSGKSPFSFDYSKLSTTRSPYDFSHFGRNANRAASNIDLTIVQPPATLDKRDDADPSGLSAKSTSTTDCLDKDSNLAGYMTCHDFLSHYGFHYCQHNFMKKRCCASQRNLCPQQHS